MDLILYFFLYLFLSLVLTAVTYMLVPVIIRIVKGRLSNKRAKIICILNCIIVAFLWTLLRFLLGEEGGASITPAILWFFPGYFLIRGNIEIFPQKKAEKALSKLREGKTIKLSISQIVDTLVDIDAARMNLSGKQFAIVWRFYETYKHNLDKIYIDIDTYHTTSKTIIEKFDAIAPFNEYSQLSEDETDQLLEEIKEQKDPEAREKANDLETEEKVFSTFADAIDKVLDNTFEDDLFSDKYNQIDCILQIRKSLLDQLKAAYNDRPQKIKSLADEADPHHWALSKISRMVFNEISKDKYSNEDKFTLESVALNHLYRYCLGEALRCDYIDRDTYNARIEGFEKEITRKAIKEIHN